MKAPIPSVPRSEMELNPEAGDGSAPARYGVRRAGRDDRLRVARRLVGRAEVGGKVSSGGENDAGRRFLDSAEAHGIDIGEMWFSFAMGGEGESGGEPREVALIVPGSGRSGMVFTSTPRGRSGIAGDRRAGSAGEGGGESLDSRQRELAAVIERACEGVSSRGKDVVLAQALLDPSSEADCLAKRSFEMAGFAGVGTLAYMSRATPDRRWLGGGAGEREGKESAEEGWPAGVRARRYMSADEPALIGALERTYIDTLDCPELCGLRATADVLESHRSTGRFDPELWWMIEMEGRVEGVLMLNACPEQMAIELVYLGLAPAARGRGLGRRLLSLGLEKVAGRRERVVNLAVDERNVPAVRVYESLGFRVFARRSALVKVVGRGAGCAHG